MMEKALALLILTAISHANPASPTVMTTSISISNTRFLHNPFERILTRTISFRITIAIGFVRKSRKYDHHHFHGCFPFRLAPTTQQEIAGHPKYIRNF